MCIMYASNCGIQLIYAEMLFFLKSFPQVQNQQNLPYAFIFFGQGDLCKVLFGLRSKTVCLCAVDSGTHRI